MMKAFPVGLAMMLAALPAATAAQEGAKLDCGVAGMDVGQRSLLGSAMVGEGAADAQETLIKELAAIIDGCAESQGIAADLKTAYFDYSIARVAREWLSSRMAESNMSTIVIDRALDFGPTGANPDLSQDMSEEQIMKIVQAYIDSGIDIEKVDPKIWELVGAYAASTSIYWNRRKSLTE